MYNLGAAYYLQKSIISLRKKISTAHKITTRLCLIVNTFQGKEHNFLIKNANDSYVLHKY